MSDRRYDTIFLDAGNTLLHVDRRRIFEAVSEAGVDPDETTFTEAEFDARHELSERVREGGSGTEDHIWNEYFLTIFRRLGVPDGALAMVGKRVRGMHRERHLWTRVEPGTGEALAELRERGYRLAVISNADGSVEALLEGAGLRKHLETVVDSHLVGVEKPDPRIFEIGLERMEVEAGESLYVGDLFPVDVVGARGAGLDAVLVDPVGKKELPCDRIASVVELPEYLDGR